MLQRQTGVLLHVFVVRVALHTQSHYLPSSMQQEYEYKNTGGQMEKTLQKKNLFLETLLQKKKLKIKQKLIENKSYVTFGFFATFCSSCSSSPACKTY